MSKILGKPTNLASFLLSPPAEPEPIVKDILVKEGTYGMLFGTAASAKSFLLQALMVDLAMGEKFFAEGVATDMDGTDGRRITFLDFDQGEDTTMRRFWKLANWAKYSGAEEVLGEKIAHFCPPNPFDMFNGDHQAELAAHLKEHRTDVLVIDCLARTLGDADENSTATANQYFRVVKVLQEICKQDGHPLTVIVVHHQRKAQTQTQNGNAAPQAEEMRGASGWRDSLDFQWQVWKRGDVVGLSKRKERNAQNCDLKMTFRMVDREDPTSGETVAVKFIYETDADIKVMAEVVWSGLSALTGGIQAKGVGPKELFDYLRAMNVDKRPNRTQQRDALAYLQKAGRISCSEQDIRSRNPKKTVWTNGG